MNIERQKSVAKYWNEKGSLERIEGMREMTFRDIVKLLEKSHPFVQIKHSMELLVPMTNDEVRDEFIKDMSNQVNDLIMEYLSDYCTFKKVQQGGIEFLNILKAALTSNNDWEVKPYLNFNRGKAIKINASEGTIVKSSTYVMENQTEENFYEKELSF